MRRPLGPACAWHDRTFGTLEEGMAYAEEIGFPDEIIGRGTRTANEPPTELVYAGFPPGVVSAQKLAQTRGRPRRAAVLFLRAHLLLRTVACPPTP